MREERRTVRDLLERRFGVAGHDGGTPGTEVVELLLRHRTVRTFLPQPVEEEVLRLIVAAAQSASTSANFQFTSVVSVRDPARRDRLAVYAGDQQLVRDAGAFLVWVADWSRSVSIARAHGLPTGGADYLDSTVSSIVDVALAAQNAAVAAESLGYGITFVGALRNRVDEVCAELELPEWTFPLFGLAIGVPAPDDPADVKPRLGQDVVLHQETYTPPDPGAIADYRRRIGRYYTEQEKPADWVQDRLAWRIADKGGLDGRHTIRDSFHRQGFPLK
ncbi:nitroreductase family protein [Nonomuraea zeae]|uniref:NADPH-dependent oxidoreductase n=1 Tax=Nonomuraea zeae TaxID=1642303 RepID=A0A5S4GSP4_9ACTN|nr:nitroreductase family protein [Nonomuraea zeae]TMR35965.1 NADPH-dependent oxidoreductase [Nonomuraea zeae]